MEVSRVSNDSPFYYRLSLPFPPEPFLVIYISKILVGKGPVMSFPQGTDPGEFVSDLNYLGFEHCFIRGDEGERDREGLPVMQYGSSLFPFDDRPDQDLNWCFLNRCLFSLQALFTLARALHDEGTVPDPSLPHSIPQLMDLSITIGEINCDLLVEYGPAVGEFLSAHAPSGEKGSEIVTELTRVVEGVYGIMFPGAPLVNYDGVRLDQGGQLTIECPGDEAGAGIYSPDSGRGEMKLVTHRITNPASIYILCCVFAKLWDLVWAHLRENKE